MTLPLFASELQAEDFSCNDLTGTLPSSWSQLTELDALNLERNQLNGTLPVSWGNLTQIIFLDLGLNDLSGTLPSEWSTLDQLFGLRLDSNRLTGTVSDAWKNLTQVSLATFAHNQFSGRVSVLPNVSLLNLGYNFTNLSLADLPPSLELLYLEHNNLVGSVPSFHDLPANMVFLDISNNRLLGSLPAVLPTNLAVLNASGNSLTGSLPSAWSTSEKLVELRLDNNNFTGVLPASWLAWGQVSHNSLQLSVTNASLHGKIPQEWVKQFCLASIASSVPQVLFEQLVVHVDAGAVSRAVVAYPALERPAQHASINVTLGSQTFSFDYDSPDSICGIPNAARNVGLLWGIYAALFLASILVVQVWLRRKNSVTDGGFSRFSKGLRSRVSAWSCISKLQLPICRQIAHKVWFFLSDAVFVVYSQITDIITIHQVFTSKQVQFAFLLLAIFLLPTAIMLASIARVSARACQQQVLPFSHSRLASVSAYMLGVLLSPVLLLGLEVAMILRGVGMPLPRWVNALDLDLYTFYRLQSFAESIPRVGVVWYWNDMRVYGYTMLFTLMWNCTCCHDVQ